MGENHPPLEYDDEARNLQLAAEKARLRLAIADAERSLVAATKQPEQAPLLIPNVEGAPTGTVTVGEGAGAFGPWLAQMSLEESAKAIADTVLAKASGAGCLVVEGRALAAGSFASTWVREQLDRIDGQLTHAGNSIDDAIRLATPEADQTGTPRLPHILPGGTDADFEIEEDTGSASNLGATAATGLSTGLGLLGLLGADYSITTGAVTTTTVRLAILTAPYRRRAPSWRA